MKRIFSIPYLTLLLLLLPALSHADTRIITPRIVDEYPHSICAYTQGLFFHEGMLYESSGGYEKSYLAIVQPHTGLHVVVQEVPGLYFAEGIAPNGNTLRLLTWKSGVGFIHDMTTLKPLGQFTHNKDTQAEGWGLASDGTTLYRSSGSSRITLHNPADFSQTGSFEVTDNGRPVRMLNELEWIDGMLFANIWKSDTIAAIDPASGTVRAWIDLTEIRKRIRPESKTANGIAYDKQTGRIFITGKEWDKLFVIDVNELFEE